MLFFLDDVHCFCSELPQHEPLHTGQHLFHAHVPRRALRPGQEPRLQTGLYLHQIPVLTPQERHHCKQKSKKLNFKYLIHYIKGEPELTDPFNLLINVKLRML